MLAILAKRFELTEENTTARALRRIWWMMVLSMPAFPIVVWVGLFGLPSNVIAVLISIPIVLIASVAMIGFGSSRFVNRFYFPDKYLDEWEIRIKHKSIVFAVQVFMCSALAVGAVAVTLGRWFNVASLSFTALQIGAGALFLLIAFFYVQACKALSLIQPIDEDEYTTGPTEKRDSRYILLFLGTVIFVSLILSAPLIRSSYDSGREYGRAMANCHNQDMKLDEFNWKTGESTCKASIEGNADTVETVD